MLAAVAGIVYALVITVVVIACVGAAGLVTLFVWRWRRSRPEAARIVPLQSPVPVRAAHPLPQPPPAIEQAPEVHVHHHWHGVSAEDVAAILRDGNAVNPGSGPRVTPAWPKRE